MNEVLVIFVRSVSIYLFIVLAIRLFGKKELTQLSVIDLVFILLISNAVQAAMIGENTSLLGGVVAAGSLFIVNYLLKNLFFRSKSVSQFFQGSPLVLIYQGKPLPKNLDEAKMSLEELNAAVREHGIEKINEVDLAVLEIDGNISVLSNDFRKRSVRKRKAHKIISKNE
ncbi:MAG: DUF421 domain-containing protein [Patescibacteria group bacterium]|nr:DUF421 domain-containing protein [Patescibacteria group bacterium]